MTQRLVVENGKKVKDMTGPGVGVHRSWLVARGFSPKLMARGKIVTIAGVESCEAFVFVTLPYFSDSRAPCRSPGRGSRPEQRLQVAALPVSSGSALVAQHIIELHRTRRYPHPNMQFRTVGPGISEMCKVSPILRKKLSCRSFLPC